TIAAGNLTITVNTGNLVQSANSVITVGGASRITAANGAINLSGRNALTGDVSLSANAAGNVAIGNNRALSLGDVLVTNGTLTVNVTGNISQAANATINVVTGNSSFTATNGS